MLRSLNTSLTNGFETLSLLVYKKRQIHTAFAFYEIRQAAKPSHRATPSSASHLTFHPTAKQPEADAMSQELRRLQDQVEQQRLLNRRNSLKMALKIRLRFNPLSECFNRWITHMRRTKFQLSATS